MTKNNISLYFFYMFLTLNMISFSLSSIHLKGKVDLENPSSSRISSTTISLIWGGQVSPINEEGQFNFLVEPGIYLIKVNDPEYSYPLIFVDAKEEEIKVYEYNFRYGRGKKKRYPIKIKSNFKYIKGEQKQDILKGIIRSPYAIMISITIVLFLCMKMVPQEELQAQQEEMRKKFQSGGMGSWF